MMTEGLFRSFQSPLGISQSVCDKALPQESKSASYWPVAAHSSLSAQEDPLAGSVGIGVPAPLYVCCGLLLQCAQANHVH